MKRMSFILAIGLVSAFLFIGCGPKVENELKYWENHKKDMAEAKEKYPNFAKVIDARFAVAEKMFNDANALKGEEQAKALKAANEKLDEVVGQFSQIKYKTEGVEKSLKKLNDLKLTEPAHSNRNKASAAAYGGLSEVATSISKATPATEEEALKVTKDAISKLISLQGDVDRAVSAAKPAPAPKKKK